MEKNVGRTSDEVAPHSFFCTIVSGAYPRRNPPLVPLRHGIPPFRSAVHSPFAGCRPAWRRGRKENCAVR